MFVYFKYPINTFPAICPLNAISTLTFPLLGPKSIPRPLYGSRLPSFSTL